MNRGAFLKKIVRPLAKETEKAARGKEQTFLDRVAPYVMKVGAVGGLAGGDVYMRYKGRKIEEGHPGQEPDPAFNGFFDMLYIQPRRR